MTIVADRGFSATKLFVFLMEPLGFDFIIRLRSNTRVGDSAGESRKAAQWVSALTAH